MCRKPTVHNKPEPQLNTNENGYNIDSDEYSFINTARMYTELPVVAPRLPQRDDTYAQAFEDTRLPNDAGTPSPFMASPGGN